MLIQEVERGRFVMVRDEDGSLRRMCVLLPEPPQRNPVAWGQQIPKSRRSAPADLGACAFIDAASEPQSPSARRK